MRLPLNIGIKTSVMWIYVDMGYYGIHYEKYFIWVGSEMEVARNGGILYIEWNT